MDLFKDTIPVFSLNVGKMWNAVTFACPERRFGSGTCVGRCDMYGKGKTEDQERITRRNTHCGMAGLAETPTPRFCFVRACFYLTRKTTVFA